jgi:iron complex outermembrane receptor protein
MKSQAPRGAAVASLIGCVSSRAFGTFLGLTLVFPCAGIFQTSAAEESQDREDLLRLSFEELGRIQVTTVSRKGESLSGAAAAIYVITPDEIRRSGVNSLAETLRMVPGLAVGRANSHGWAVGARGYGYVYANKLLALQDGRSIYTPLFAGTFWEETDTVLEDIDRIEVIRGPGAALWGANAVNGVINIITKSAKDTQGVLLTGGGGVEEKGFGTVRYGGKLSTNAYYRVYTKFSDRDQFTRTDGEGAGDAWWISQSGFRMDWEASEINTVTLQGDYYYSELDTVIRRPSFSPPGMFKDAILEIAHGGNVLGRWTHLFSADSNLAVQMYYDHTDRDFGLGREIRDTVDVDAQHHFHVGERQEIVWGGGYRYSVDVIHDNPEFKMRDPHAGLQLASAFLQDEIALVPDRLRVTLGTKLEHNSFTGFEVQPNGRVAWTPNVRHTLWSSVSRAVRTPSRSERDLTLYLDLPSSVPPLPLPAVIPLSGNPEFGSEELMAYEVGYRVMVHPKLTLDFAAFYNDYDRLKRLVQSPAELRLDPMNRPFIYIPVTVDNSLYGEGYGAELAATWQPRDWWRVRASYSFLELQLHTRGPVRSNSEGDEGIDPAHQVKLWSDMDLGRQVEWGLGWRYVSSEPFIGVPGYAELDTRLAWKPNPHCEFAIVGRSLLARHHREFSPYVIIDPNVAVDRTVYAKLTFRF